MNTHSVFLCSYLPIDRLIIELYFRNAVTEQYWTIYALASQSRNYIYVGLTSNLQERIKRHNEGFEKTTKPYAPFKLIFTESVFGLRKDARIREKYWKSGTGKEQLRMLRDDCAGLSTDR